MLRDWIRRNVQHRINTLEFGRPVRIKGAQLRYMDGRVVAGIEA